MALLAMYRKERQPGETLEQYLAEKVFAGAAGEQVAPDPRDREGFDRYLERYRACLPAEKLLGQR